MTAPGMRNTLTEPRVAAALKRMFALADEDDAAYQRSKAAWPEGYEPTGSQQLADAAAEVYMPVSEDGGRLLYTLIRAVRPTTVVEFGMSFGISTLHLAAAVRDNGFGRVVTTELSAAKVEAARRTFAETGLDEVVTVLEGDALETLPRHLDAVADGADPAGSVGFVLLDGWKDLYLPVLCELEPRLAPGTLVVADDTAFESVQPYLRYVREPGNGYQGFAFPVEDGMEISCRL